MESQSRSSQAGHDAAPAPHSQEPHADRPQALLGFLLIFLPALLLILLGAYSYGRSEIRIERDRIAAQDRESVEVGAQSLAQYIEEAGTDIEYLISLPRLHRALARPDRVALAELAEDLQAYVGAHANLDQVRWLDVQGMERLRINGEASGARRVPDAQLQSKADREYFRAAMALDAERIYLSPLELNIEHGRIDRPLKPTLRLARPIVDAQGHRHGVLVINYRSAKLLSEFVAAAGAHGASVTLVNREGYWLVGPQSGDEWGFMLGRPDATLARREPEAWTAMQGRARGQVLLADGLWTWTRVNPLEQINNARYQAGARGPRVIGRYDYAWFSMAHVPQAVLAAAERRVWSALALPIGTAIMVAALFGALVARARVNIRRLNRQLQERAEAAEAAARAKADFLANMSHEIRTPMNAIMGLAYLLESDRLSESAADLVRKIRIASRSLLALINDILDFSRIESGHLAVESVPFSLAEVLEHLSTIMSASVADKDIELTIAPPPGGVDMLRGDPLRLEQVLVNLTGNALKFTESGHVGLSVEVLEAQDGKLRLRFSVHDTGLGIAADKIESIFAPFEQADASTTRRFGGSGLGLSICRRLVELMGGEIGVRSQPGVGSTFWFTLPFERGEGRRLSAPHMAGLSVLIADDNALAREAARLFAASLGWQATAVDSGAAALSHLLERSSDQTSAEVIVLDWKMPGMDGLATARAIRRSLGDQGPGPVLVMATAYSREALQKEADVGLVDAVLTKPLTPSALYNAVHRVLLARRRSSGAGSAQAAEAGAARGARLDGLSLLVVDDSDINREVARRIFQGEGAQVHTAADGRQALDWLRTPGRRVDVVLMDVQMPVMDGFEATRRIRADAALQRLPVLALTAGALTSQRAAASAAGMTDFIAKPYDVDAAVGLILRVSGRAGGLALEGLRPELLAGAPRVAAPGVASGASALPGLQVADGLALWSDAAVYKRYLRKFLRDYGDFGERLRCLAPAEAAALLHKLKGAALTLALGEVASNADALEQQLRDAAAPESAHLVQALAQALTTAARSIASYAGDEVEPAGPAAAPPEATGSPPVSSAPRALLAATLHALEADDPAAVEPVLAELATLIGQERLAGIAAALESFDFAEARRQTRALAGALGVALEDRT